VHEEFGKIHAKRFHMELSLAKNTKFYIAPHPLCMYGRRGYSTSQPPVRVGMLGCVPSACVAGLGNLWQILAKENVSHPVITLSHPSHNPFNILDIFYSQLKPKTKWL
jgi:hypothetical protein